MRSLTKSALLILVFGGVVSVLAIGQKSEPSQPMQLPPQTPIFSAADLAAKVPAPNPEDVKSLDAIMRSMK
jgi:hypothetical protein